VFKIPEENEKHRVVLSMGAVALVNAVGVVLGFGRRATIGGYFGTAAEADAYFAAYFVPDQLQQLLISGVLAGSFIPILADSLKNDRSEESWRLISTVANLMLLVLSALTLGGIVIAPTLVKLLFPGFSSEVKDLTTTLLRIVFPVIVLTGCTGLAGGILNTYGHFVTPALSSSVFSLVIILSVVLCADRFGIVALALGTALAGVFQLGVQFPVLAKIGLQYRPVLNLHNPKLLQLGKLAAPLFLRLVFIQGYSVAERFFASLLSMGSISALSYAQPIALTPVNVVGAAIPIVLFPTLSRQAAVGDFEAFGNTLFSWLQRTLIIMVPISIFAIVFSTPIVQLLFERGTFDRAATQATAWALLFYSVGLFAYPASWLLMRGFFALQDAVTPMVVTAVSCILAVLFDSWAIRYLAHGGLALGYSLQAILQAVVMLFIAQKRLKSLSASRLTKESAKILIAAVVSAGVCYFLWSWLSSMNSANLTACTALYVTLTIFVSLSLYWGTLIVLRSVEALNMTKQMSYWLFSRHGISSG
jgi:putative peptidoglycan lipid II flippase